MKKTRIGLSDDEVRIIVLSLVELRNALIQEVVSWEPEP